MPHHSGTCRVINVHIPRPATMEIRADQYVPYAYPSNKLEKNVKYILKHPTRLSTPRDVRARTRRQPTAYFRISCQA